jgi:hypothetical protein
VSKSITVIIAQISILGDNRIAEHQYNLKESLENIIPIKVSDITLIALDEWMKKECNSIRCFQYFLLDAH